tara:strand:- start:6306 stop:6467 length:162 start_codon:yes stop_codon:yes gene_type:complete
MPVFEFTKNPVPDFAIVYSVIHQFYIIISKDQRSILKIQTTAFQRPLTLLRIE